MNELMPGDEEIIARIQAREAAADSRVRATVYQAAGTAPDQYADQRRMAQRLGVPPAVVMAQPQQSRDSLVVNDAADAAAAHPVLKDRFSNDDFARLAHDDSGNLATLGRWFGNAAKYVVSADKDVSLMRSIAGAVPGTLRQVAGAARAVVDTAAATPIGPALGNLAGDANPYASNPLTRYSQGLDKAATYFGQKSKEWGSQYAGEDAATQIFGGGVDSGVQSFIQNVAIAGVALGTLGPAGIPAAVGVMSAMQGGESYQKAQEKGKSPFQSLAYGLQDATAEYVGERYFGMAGFLSKAVAGASASKLVAYELFREVPGEVGTTLWQNFNEWANLNPQKTVGEFIQEQPVAIAQTVVATLVGGGGNVALASSLRTVMQNAAGAQQQVAQAEHSTQQIQQLFTLASQQQLRERAPETFAGMVQQMAEQSDGAVPTAFHIDAATLVGENGEGGLLNQSEIDTLLPSVGPQLAEALATGGSVSIPVGELLANATGTPLEAKLLPYLRATPDALSQDEAKQAAAGAAEYLQSQADRVMAVSSDAAATQDSGEKVKQFVLDQLNQSNRFTPDVNESYARLHQAFATVMGAREGLTPEQFFTKHALRVAGVNPATAGEVLNAGEQTTTPEFKAWFGDSKVVDAEGKPLVVYHGTPADVGQFDINAKRNMAAFRDAQGFYFTNNPRDAAAYTEGEDGDPREGANIMPVYLQMKNPLHVNAGDTDNHPAYVSEARRAALEAQGYDGIVYANGVEFVAFRPEQIKSAIGNNGQFNPNDPSILHQTVSTRTPVPKGGREDPHLSTGLEVGLEALNEAPALKAKLADLVAGYVTTRKSKASVDKRIEAFVNQAKDNLLWLYDQVPAETRARSKLWYDGGRQIIDDWVARYDGRYTDAQLAGVLASMSPQMAWDANVSLGERIVDIYTQHQDTAWSDKMATVADTIASRNAGRVGAIDETRGKTLGELTSPFLKAVWIRLYDEAHNDRSYRLVTPEGGFVDKAKINSGADAIAAWGNGFEPIAKAVSILEDGSAENISRRLGEAHKVRNFYNNLFDPRDPRSVTIDTHAVAAGLLLPLGGSSQPVTDALNGPGNDAAGLTGTYALYAEAYRRAAAERGVLPRELQSITWEALRGMFTPGFKSAYSKKGKDGKSSPARVAFDAIWKDYNLGKVDLDETRQRILDIAGGIDQPRWVESDSGLHEGAPASSYQGDLRGPELAGGGAQPDAAGVGAGPAAGVSDRQFAADPAAEVTHELAQSATPGGEQAPTSSVLDASGVRGSPGVLDVAPGADSVADRPLVGLPTSIHVDGRDVTFGPHAPARRAAEAYMVSAGLPYLPPATYTKVDPARAARIAAAYEAMPHAPNDPAVKEAYAALTREVTAQWQAVKATGLRVEYITGQDPYGNPRNAILDIVENNHFWVYPTADGFGSSEVDTSDSPMLAVVPGESFGGKPVTVNDLFRVVHDYFGHAKEGVGFRADGEENAWRSHWAMLSPLARAAVTTETRGQNSWVNFGPHAEANKTASGADTVYADQKVGLLPAWAVNEGATDATTEVGGVTYRQSPVSPITGVHFSRVPRAVLDGRMYGSGLKGLEADRLGGASDPRLKDRVYFYVDEGKGITPEAGVGGYAHEAQLPPLYDAQANPLGLWKSDDLNLTESRILDAGFAGYFVRNIGNGQGAAVVLGPQSQGMAAKPIVAPGSTHAATVQAPQPYKRGLTSAETNRLEPGMAKVQAAAPSAKLRFGTLSVNAEELGLARAAAAEFGVELPASAFSQGPRGTFNPATLTISLLEKADLSTFLHETGHYFLEVMSDVASQANAPADVQQDMKALLKWFGVKGDKAQKLDALGAWNAMTLEQKRAHHEQMAEAFEQYLMEGKAPNQELQPLFQKFRSWMLNVYTSLKSFLAGHNTQLTPTVREVFDRMLATDESIKQAEEARAYAPLFKSAAEAGMSPEEWAKYQATGEDATQAAVAALQTRSLRDMRWTSSHRLAALKGLQKDATEKRKAVEAEVTAELAATPVERARAYIKDVQTTSPEDKAALAAWKTERAAEEVTLAATVKAELLATPDGEAAKGIKRGQFLARNKRQMANEVERRALAWEQEHQKPKAAPNPADLEVAAAHAGFTSGDELRQALVDNPPMAELIEPMTDQRMLERYGDLTTPAGIARAADEAVHNEARARFIATGLKALIEGNKQSETPPGQKRSVNVIVQAAKQFAEGLVARRKLRDLRTSEALAAETRAGKKALEATAAGDTKLAIAAARDQLLNHYTARVMLAVQGEVEKAVAYLRKTDASTSLPPEYKDQIDKLLERFDLRKVSNKAIDRRASLLEWVDSQRALGIEPELPAGLLAEAQQRNYRDLTVEEFRGLVDAVKQIDHLGRLKSKLLAAKDKRDFAAVRDGIAASINDLAGDRTADTRTPTTNWGRAMQGLRNFGAAHIKAATWARVMDGGKDGGAVWEAFIRPANTAGDFEVKRRAQATQDLSTILAPWFAEGKTGGTGMFFPSVKASFNRESLLAIALNTGNAGNLQRLLGGENWTQAQLDPLLATLSRNDWATVQKIWDYMGGFKAEIAAKSLRIYGVEPKWVEPVPRQVTLADGATVGLKGGYYPIKYDPAASVRAEEHADAEGAQRQLKGAYGAATTRRSFTKARVEEVSGRPLLYTLSGVYSGVNDVIHDLAWHEWLIDTNRLLKSTAIDSAIREHYGPAVVRQFKSWRDAIAEGEAGATEAMDAMLGRLRQGVSISGLGFNVISAAMQPLGISNTVVRIGWQWAGKGIQQYLAGPVAATADVHARSEFMAGRARTQFRELNELRNRVQGQDGILQAVQGPAYWMMMQAQQTVDIPTWLGAYEKAVAEGNDDERAVALSDQAVIDAQGDGSVKDLSAIQRGGPAQKLFTVFYSFMNTALNLSTDTAMSPKARGKKAADLMLVLVVPAMLSALVRNALVPGDSGDDKDWKTLLKKLLGEQLSFLMGLMVGARELAEAGKTVAGLSDRPRDYSGPAGVRLIADATQAAKQIAQGEFDDQLRKSTINLLGDAVGLPSAQINRTITGVKALKEGKTKNPLAVAFGYQEPQ